MGKKIIAFISPFPKDSNGKPFKLTNDPDKYYYYDSDNNECYVEGLQTNEAPIRRLLRYDGEISEVVCVCTEKSKQVDGRDGVNISPFKYLDDTFPQLHFDPVDSDDDNLSFETKALPAILKKINADDEIYLETTGGFRNAVTQLLLLSRILHYKGIPLKYAVYSNFSAKPKKRIEDVTDTYRTFDLINGLNEFNRFGLSVTLDKYYDGRPTTPAVDKLLKSMKDLSEALTLCRTVLIDERRKAVMTAINEAENDADPLLQALLPIFKKKFDEISTTPQQIIWCAENGLIQQAFTIYRDRLPKYIIEEANLISFSQKAIQDVKSSKSDDEELYNYLFTKKYLTASYGLRWHFYNAGKIYDNLIPDGSVFIDYVPLTMENYEYVFNGFRFDNRLSLNQRRKCFANEMSYAKGISFRDMFTVLKDFVYAYYVRNKLNHVNEEKEGSAADPKEIYLKNLNDPEYNTNIDAMTLNDFKSFITSAMNRLDRVIARKKP